MQSPGSEAVQRSPALSIASSLHSPSSANEIPTASWLDVLEERTAKDMVDAHEHCKLSVLVSELTARWAALPADSASEKAHSDSVAEHDDALMVRSLMSQPQLQPLTREAAAHLMPKPQEYMRTGRAALAAQLICLGLEALAERLQGETLRSCFVRLEDRPDFLAYLKECVGVSELPLRQRLANGLAKAKRTEAARRAESASVVPMSTSAAGPSALWCDRGGRGAPVTVTPTRSPGRLPGLHSVVLLPSMPSLRGLLVTATGTTVFLNGRPPATGAFAAAVGSDGPLVHMCARLAALCEVHVAIVSSLPLDDAAAAPRAAAKEVTIALGCPPTRVHLLLTGRQWDADAPPNALPILPPHTHWLPTLDAFAAADTDERPVTRRSLTGRRAQAVWRGGHGRAAESCSVAESMRSRVVRHCAHRPDLYDVGFGSEARALSRRQQTAYRVRLLIDAPSDGWDVAWRWALGSGSVLVVIGSWVPAIPTLEAGVHYVPVRADLSDLDERVTWALEHPDALAIARRAAELHAALQAPGHAMRALVHIFAAAAAEEGVGEPPSQTGSSSSMASSMEEVT